MCGISGSLDLKGGTVDREILHSMTRMMRHRGPDEVGIYTDRMIGLGHTRLSIIDLVSGGQTDAQQRRIAVYCVQRRDIQLY